MRWGGPWVVSRPAEYNRQRGDAWSRLFEMVHPQSSWRSERVTPRVGRTIGSEWHRDMANNAAHRPNHGVSPDGGAPMELHSLVATLVEMISEREQRMHRQMDGTVLGYVRDAVTVELEHRRRMHELDRRLTLLTEPVVATDGE